ncbi:hypothetical protein AB0J86_34715 [Micromonospora sp. NPDC049559]|uniref:hypothetical protein n=1 Tax=Micromonospora sp. NPDC049559 TaxID=3155923 RepID=UPI003412F5A9
MRARLCLIGASLLVLAGCAQDPAADRPVLGPPEAVELPAASAGGACAALDFAVVEQATGARFDVSAASQVRQTHTCVLRSQETTQPELALSVTRSSSDAQGFKTDMVPQGAKAVSGLGKAAYRQTSAPARGAGPAVEVGWLSNDGRLVIMRYTFPADQNPDDADAFAEKLVELAKKLDVRKV